MSSETNEAKAIFLVGAGASVSFNIPDMAGMVREYQTALDVQSEDLETLKKLEAVGVDPDLEEILLAIQTILELPKTPLYNTFFQTVEEDLGGDSTRAKKTFEERQRKIEQLKNHILEWISNKCLRFDIDSAVNVWSDLVEVINDRNITVFTTNYDFAVEVVARLGENPVVDNFIVKPRKPNRMFWDDSLMSFKGDGLKIVKLHGSINWYATKEGSDIERLDLAALTNQEGEEVSRVQIFPTRFKDIYDSHFFSLYKLFITELDNSDVIVVIGHSLRDEYIRAAIRERLRNPNFSLLYVGPSIPDLSDFGLSEHRQRKQVRFIEAKFEDISTSMAYILNKYGPENLGNILRSLVKGDKGGEITLSDRITFMDVGGEFLGDATIQAQAIPPAQLTAEIVLDEGEERISKVLDVTDVATEGPVVIEGLEETVRGIHFRLPDDLQPGKYKLYLRLVQESGKVIVEKDYVCNIRGPELQEEEQRREEAPGETSEEQPSDETKSEMEVLDPSMNSISSQDTD